MAPLFETIFPARLSPHTRSPTKNNLGAIFNNTRSEQQQHPSSFLSLPGLEGTQNDKKPPGNRLKFNAMFKDERDEKLTSISRHLRELSKATDHDHFVTNSISGSSLPSLSSPTRCSHEKREHRMKKLPSSMNVMQILNRNNSNHTLLEGMNLLHNLLILELQKYEGNNANHYSQFDEEDHSHILNSTTLTDIQSVQQSLERFLTNTAPPHFSDSNSYCNNDHFNFPSFHQACLTLISTLQNLTHENDMLHQQDLKSQQEQLFYSAKLEKLTADNRHLQRKNHKLQMEVESLRGKLFNDSLQFENDMKEMRGKMRALYEERMYSVMLFHESVLRGEMIQQQQEHSKKEAINSSKKKSSTTSSSSPTSVMSSLVWLVEKDGTREKDDEGDSSSTTTPVHTSPASPPPLSLSPPQSSSLLTGSDATLTISFKQPCHSTIHRTPKLGAFNLSGFIAPDRKNVQCQKKTSKDTSINAGSPTEEKMVPQEEEGDSIVVIPSTKSSGVRLVPVPIGTNGSDTTNKRKGKDDCKECIFLVYAINDHFDESLNGQPPPIGSKLISLNCSPIQKLKLKSVKELKEQILAEKENGSDTVLAFRKMAIDDELNKEQQEIFYEACKKFEGEKGRDLVAALSPFKKKTTFSKAVAEKLITSVKEKEDEESRSETIKSSKNRKTSFLLPKLPARSSTNQSSPLLSSSSSLRTSFPSFSATLTKNTTSSMPSDDDTVCSSSSSSSCLSLSSDVKGTKVATASNHPCNAEEKTK